MASAQSTKCHHMLFITDHTFTKEFKVWHPKQIRFRSVAVSYQKLHSSHEYSIATFPLLPWFTDGVKHVLTTAKR